MKKSKIFMLCGIGLLVTSVLLDIVLSCTFVLPGALMFSLGKFSGLRGDVVAIVIGYILIRRSKKLEEQGE